MKTTKSDVLLDAVELQNHVNLDWNPNKRHVKSRESTNDQFGRLNT